MKTMAVQCHIIHPTGRFSGLGPRSVWFPRGFLKRFSACQARQVGTWFYPQLQPSATLQVSGSSLCLSNPEALATAQRGKSWKGIGKKNHEKTMGSWIGNIFWQRNKGWVMLSTQSDATPVTLLLKSSASMYHHTVDDCWQDCTLILDSEGLKQSCAIRRLHKPVLLLFVDHGWSLSRSSHVFTKSLGAGRSCFESTFWRSEMRNLYCWIRKEHELNDDKWQTHDID